MIKAVLIINTAGKVRYARFFENQISLAHQLLLSKLIFSKVNERIVIHDNEYELCNFLLSSMAEWPTPDSKIIYRKYATLIFIFITDSSESQLAILDLIQVLVESLDRIFESVCELDIIFHMEKVHYLVSEMVMGGLVLEMSREEILKHLTEMNKLSAQSVQQQQQQTASSSSSLSPWGNNNNNGGGGVGGFLSNIFPRGFSLGGDSNNSNNSGSRPLMNGVASGYR